MICDDEKMVRVGLKHMIEEFSPSSHEFIEAENGQMMVELTEKQPDLAFVDIQMPIMGGLDAIEVAKSVSPSTRWVLLTGHAKFEYAQRALQLGVSEYLLKPVGMQQISVLMTKIGALQESDRTVQSYLKSVTNQDFDVSSPHSIAEMIQEITSTHNGREPAADIVSRAKAYVLQHYRSDIGVNSVADHLQITPNYLSRVFRIQTGERLSDYINEVRVLKAKELLKNPAASLKDIAEQVGYYSAKRFTKAFQRIEGVAPSVYQKKSP
jgi:YesN/AraC family two-component response regulator